MPNRAGSDTSTRILDVAESLVLENGFAATSIDKILDRLQVSKGTFFYHFKTKNDLARALIKRYAEADARLLSEKMTRAERLSDDPLQQLLIFVGLFIEMAEGLDEPNPGCLFASYAYESGQFDEEIVGIASTAILEWREAIAVKIRAAIDKHPPRAPVAVDALADMLTVILEGAYILARVLKEPSVFAQQLREYRTYLQLLFDQA